MDFKGSQFERDIILWGVRWYVAYPISYRQLEEMMHERGVEVWRFFEHKTFEKRGIVFFVHLDKTAKRVLQLISRVYWRERPGAEVH